MNKIKNTSIDMIGTLNHIFTHLQSDKDINLHMALDSNVIIISDMPKRSAIHFCTAAKKGVDVNTYAYDDGDDGFPTTAFLEKKVFNLNNMPEIEDYIISIFEL